ncbi:MAG: YbjQ family protein [Pyrinomonadaceae bacterium]
MSTNSLSSGSGSVPYEVSPPRYSVAHHMVTTAFELPGFRVRQNLGVVRGIVVRSRNLLVNIGAALQSMVGGNIVAWTRLCEQTRAEAFEIMIQHATELGANAIIGARYDATEISSGATEVLAYGTAVVVEPTDQDGYRS